MDPAALPDSDRELWLTLASGAVVYRGELPVVGGEGLEEHAAWMSLDHLDWIGAIVSLARAGSGAAADADTLAVWATTFEFEDDDDADPGKLADDDFGGPGWDHYGEALHVSLGFGVVTRLWWLLGAIDGDERLTPLGWWGLPEALMIAWNRDTN